MYARYARLCSWSPSSSLSSSSSSSSSSPPSTRQLYFPYGFAALFDLCRNSRSTPLPSNIRSMSTLSPLTQFILASSYPRLSAPVCSSLSLSSSVLTPLCLTHASYRVSCPCLFFFFACHSCSSFLFVIMIRTTYTCRLSSISFLVCGGLVLGRSPSSITNTPMMCIYICTSRSGATITIPDSRQKRKVSMYMPETQISQVTPPFQTRVTWAHEQEQEEKKSIITTETVGNSTFASRESLRICIERSRGKKQTHTRPHIIRSSKQDHERMKGRKRGKRSSGGFGAVAVWFGSG